MTHVSTYLSDLIFNVTASFSLDNDYDYNDNLMGASLVYYPRLSQTTFSKKPITLFNSSLVPEFQQPAQFTMLYGQNITFSHESNRSYERLQVVLQVFEQEYQIPNASVFYMASDKPVISTLSTTNTTFPFTHQISDYFSVLSKPCHISCELSGNGKCIDGGSCQCNTGFSGVNCQDSQCDLCDQQHTTCVSNKCQCLQGWGGELCADSTDCITKSKLACNYPNGILTTASDGSCSSQCDCNDYWIGLTCSQCSLPQECQNGSKGNKACTGCLCLAGFTGKLCSCQSSTANMMVNMYHESINELFNLKSNNKEIPSYLLLTENDIITSLRQILANYTTVSADNITTIIIQPSIITFNKKKYTQTHFSFTIRHKCDNHGISTEELNQAWNKFFSARDNYLPPLGFIPIDFDVNDTNEIPPTDINDGITPTPEEEEEEDTKKGINGTPTCTISSVAALFFVLLSILF
jgi:hypothetical protein